MAHQVRGGWGLLTDRAVHVELGGGARRQIPVQVDGMLNDRSGTVQRPRLTGGVVERGDGGAVLLELRVSDDRPGDPVSDLRCVHLRGRYIGGAGRDGAYAHRRGRGEDAGGADDYRI